jgi:hypothetical protein
MWTVPVLEARSCLIKETSGMKLKSSRSGRKPPKLVLRLPDLEHAKSVVLNSLSSTDAQRGYRHAIDDHDNFENDEFDSKIATMPPDMVMVDVVSLSRIIATPRIRLRDAPFAHQHVS